MAAYNTQNICQKPTKHKKTNNSWGILGRYLELLYIHLTNAELLFDFYGWVFFRLYC